MSKRKASATEKIASNYASDEAEVTSPKQTKFNAESKENVPKEVISDPKVFIPFFPALLRTKRKMRISSKGWKNLDCSKDSCKQDWLDKLKEDVIFPCILLSD